MRNKIAKSLINIGMEFVSTACILILFVSLFSSTALAGDTNASDKISKNDKVSAKLSSKLAESPATEQIPIIIVLKNQSISFNTTKGKSEIDNEQKNIINHLNDAKANKKAQKIKSIKIVDAVAASVMPEIIAFLGEQPEVLIVETDELFQ